MNDINLLQQCRYYKGEGSPRNSEFWSLERFWVIAKQEEDTRSLQQWYTDLRDHDLLSWANKECKDTPVTLIGLLLNRYLHHITCESKITIQEFKIYYFKEYCNSGNC